MPLKQNVVSHLAGPAEPVACNVPNPAAAYIGELAHELEKLASQDGLEALATLLRLAKIEARRLAACDAA